MTTASDLVELAGREAIARIIDPSSWAVMDSYLEQVKRQYKGENAGYDPDAFKDKASLAKADAILALRERTPLPADGGGALGLLETMKRYRKVLDLLDPGQPLKYVIAMDGFRKDMDACIAKAESVSPADGGAREAMAELHLLEEVCAFYADDEDAYLSDEGEPYGGIPTEVGLKARDARKRFKEREARLALHPSSRGEAEQK